MCRTVDRQFPPSRKVTLKKENSVLLYYGKMQIGHTHKDNSMEGRKEDHTRYSEVVWEL